LEGHVELEDKRWLHAYGLSLNLSGAGNALDESPFVGAGSNGIGDQFALRTANRESVGNLLGALFREV